MPMWYPNSTMLPCQCALQIKVKLSPQMPLQGLSTVYTMVFYSQYNKRRELKRHFVKFQSLHCQSIDRLFYSSAKMCLHYSKTIWFNTHFNTYFDNTNNNILLNSFTIIIMLFVRFVSHCSTSKIRNHKTTMPLSRTWTWTRTFIYPNKRIFAMNELIKKNG
jgi:hypothetical protein